MRTAQPLTDELIKEIHEVFVDADISLIKGVFYFDGWSSYEEYGGILIFEGVDGSIQLADYGYSVMCGDCLHHFEFTEICESEMECQIEEMEKIING